MKARPRFSRWMLGVAALVLAAHACDEGEPPPLTGITCLKQQSDGTILAPETRDSYTSADGGLTWQETGPIPGDPLKGCGEYYTTRPSWTLPDPADPRVVYRYNPEVSIERSEDGSATWHMEVNLSGTEARTRYYVNTRNDGNENRSGPLDAIFDVETENLVVAMGYEGVLVRSPQGSWTWVAVGRYSRVDMRDLSIALPLISLEIWLAVLMGAVVMGTLPTLAHGKSIGPLAGAVCSSILGIAMALFVIYGFAGGMASLFHGSGAEAVVIVGLIMALAIVIMVPTVITWKISGATRQENRLAFTWSGVGWTYLIALLILYYYVLRIGQ